VWEDGGSNPASYPILELVKNMAILKKVNTESTRLLFSRQGFADKRPASPTLYQTP